MSWCTFVLTSPRLRWRPLNSHSMAGSSQATTASECSEADIPSRINIHTTAVVAHDDVHTKLDLQLQYDRSNNTAFFKLRASLVLKDGKKTHVYLFLAPDCIKLLNLDESPDPDTIPPDLAKTLGSSFLCLRFTCSRPPDLIGPSKGGLTPKNKTVGLVLDQLRLLARSMIFSIYIPHQSISKRQLQSICDGINDKLLGTHPGQLDLATLYQGSGGVKVEVTRENGSDIALGATHASDQGTTADSGALDVLPEVLCDSAPSGDLPPSYDEESGPPPAASSSSDPGPLTKKRRRDSSGTSVAADLSPQLLTAMEAICRKLVREQVSEQIHALESRLTDKIHEIVTNHADMQSDHFQGEVQEVRDEVDGKIEDEFYGLRVRLEDFVKEEIEYAEERIVEHLQNTASVHIEFG